MASVMDRLKDAEREVVKKPDPLTDNPRAREAQLAMGGARDRLRAAMERQTAINTLLRELGGWHAKYQAPAEPPLEASAFVEWIAEAGRLAEGIRYLNGMARTADAHVKHAHAGYETSKSQFLSVVEDAYEQACTYWRQRLYIACDLDPDGKAKAQQELARLRTEWQPIFDRAMVEVAG